MCGSLTVNSLAPVLTTNSWSILLTAHSQVTCYWRRLFWTWSSVQGFEPQLYTQDGSGNMVMRGTPWTAFAANWPHDPSVIP